MPRFTRLRELSLPRDSIVMSCTMWVHLDSFVVAIRSPADLCPGDYILQRLQTPPDDGLIHLQLTDLFTPIAEIIVRRIALQPHTHVVHPNLTVNVIYFMMIQDVLQL